MGCRLLTPSPGCRITDKHFSKPLYGTDIIGSCSKSCVYVCVCVWGGVGVGALCVCVCVALCVCVYVCV